MNRRLKYAEAKAHFDTMLQNGSTTEQMEESLHQMIEEAPREALKYKKAFFASVKDADLDLAIKYGEEVLKSEHDPKFMKVLAVRYKRAKKLAKYKSLEERLIPIAILKEQIARFNEKKVPFQVIDDYVDTFLASHPDLSLMVYKVVFGLLKDTYTMDVLKYGEVIIEAETDKKFMQVLAARYKKISDMERYNALSEIIQSL